MLRGIKATELGHVGAEFEHRSRSLELSLSLLSLTPLAHPERLCAACPRASPREAERRHLPLSRRCGTFCIEQIKEPVWDDFYQLEQAGLTYRKKPICILGKS